MGLQAAARSSSPAPSRNLSFPFAERNKFYLVEVTLFVSTLTSCPRGGQIESSGRR